jgi:NAD+ kinase
MERVGVVVHPSRPVGEALEVLREWTRAHGCELVQIQVGNQPTVAPAGKVTGSELVVALGGDGTVLKALHSAAGTGTAVLGIAFGSLGALTSVPASGLRAALDRFRDGAYTELGLPALAVRAEGEPLGWGINDVVASRRGATQLGVDVYVEDELYVRLSGDGLVAATPLGSSAYSMAADGALLAPGLDGFICTPVAMHGGSGPPLVVPNHQSVRLELHPGHGGFGLQIDGVELDTRSERFTLRTQPDYSHLVQFDDSRSRLNWLRDRGLISDSPRVLAQQHRVSQPPDKGSPAQ